ncbi:uncharacterized protein LOC143620067 [Bidens hawaiensis]|uniref:uncharacterized protein LOC143620067 n=1 Tax=Bidens hawaiensis TaxID=980011 RepID=UPI00404A305D
MDGKQRGERCMPENNEFNGISKDYLDHGNQSVVCEMCHAKLWDDEARRGKRKEIKVTYSLCCHNGAVELPPPVRSDPEYEELFKSNNAKSKFFLKNIRRYNSMFSFTSMGGKVDSSINKGKALYVFRMSGQNYHAIGSLLPKDGTKPKFSQLYIYDTETKFKTDKPFLDTNADTSVAEKMLDTEIIIWLKEMLDRQNVLVQTYRMARDVYKQQPATDMKLRLICNRQQDGRTYNLPTTSEVAALIVGDIEESYEPRDIFVNKVGAVYMVEFQKRGLPHTYICLFMQKEDKLPNVEHVDPYISAEIPNKNEDPELYNLVAELMMHDNKCSKNFPKKFQDETSIDTYGFPLYRRRDSGAVVEKSDVNLVNRSVVPYNKKLLKRYQAHINVEWCNQGSSIKYLFKYINKGPDCATVYFSNSGEDEKNTDPCEASWRIFGFDVHYRIPTVMRLPFHLPGKQQVIYGTEDDIDNVLEKTDTIASSMFELWMKCNSVDREARKLTYSEFPTKFVWHDKPHGWQRRNKGFYIGRIHAVSPALGEAYFLRVLLTE